ncbi:hypothetical protein N7467_009253 [Penicillium canescens]|nr:hypothetical protein N7467_009253 [Penicillium canescens]
MILNWLMFSFGYCQNVSLFVQNKMSAYITKRNLASIVDSLDLYGIHQALKDQVFTSEDLVDMRKSPYKD